LFGSDEVARPGATDPRQAVETCGMVEFMHSSERLLLATGDLVWADRCEEVAFNQLPAALTADSRGLRYLSAPNMAASDRTSHAPGLMNGGPMYCFDPHDHRCCQHNVGHGWPYLAQHLWLATADDGLCLAMPLESKVRARVGVRGAEVELETLPGYPFAPFVGVVVRAAQAVLFPLYVRVPGWSEATHVSVAQGEPVEWPDAAGKLVRIEREWNSGDRLLLSFSSAPRVRRWPGNKDCASIEWGPLVYALEIASETVRSGGTDAWPAFEVLPRGPWNYALDLSEPEIAVEWSDVDAQALDTFRWDPEHVFARLKVKARRAPGWTLDRHALVAPLVQSPVRADAAVETVALIPMGAARIRITAFPVAGEGATGNDWPPPPEPPHPAWRVRASHTFEHDSAEACFDGVEAALSGDATIPRHTFWPRKGSSEWIEYEFDAPRRVVASDVLWFDDTGRGGCAIPERWSLAWRDESGHWRDLPRATYEPAARDMFCRATFDPVTATAVRLHVGLQPERSGGVLEWRVTTAP
jgi:hypothetical protein